VPIGPAGVRVLETGPVAGKLQYFVPVFTERFGIDYIGFGLPGDSMDLVHPPGIVLRPQVEFLGSDPVVREMSKSDFGQSGRDSHIHCIGRLWPDLEGFLIHEKVLEKKQSKNQQSSHQIQ
jgi:hypothetical protein